MVTGVAGFIGYHLTDRLCQEGFSVIGLDNLNNYYSTKLKHDRLAQLDKYSMNGKFKFYKIDISEYESLESIFNNNKFDLVVNLAAQAGVRYSLKNPLQYIKSNVQGFMNILELCRFKKIKKILYASSSSVYGGNIKFPFSENDRVDTPLSIYAASKRSNELMAYTYSHLYDINTIGLRFFTVYGPWGRPDMALDIFTSKIIKKEKIQIFNNGENFRSYTYINDIIESMSRLISMKTYTKKDLIFNIGTRESINLMEYISLIEKNLSINGIYEYLPMQLGDLVKTKSDSNLLEKMINYSPSTDIESGISKYIEWHKSYYKKLHESSE